MNYAELCCSVLVRCIVTGARCVCMTEEKTRESAESAQAAFARLSLDRHVNRKSLSTCRNLGILLYSGERTQTYRYDIQ
jgi:hypothetical protein